MSSQSLMEQLIQELTRVIDEAPPVVPEPEVPTGPAYDTSITPVWGLDVSDFDYGRGMRPSNIVSARSEGIRFMTAKVTELAHNGQWHHRNAQALLRAGRDAGIPFLGSYIVVRTPGPSINQQVTAAIAEQDRTNPWWKDFPGWFWKVDTERWTYDAVAFSHGMDMCNRLRSVTGQPVLMYASGGHYPGANSAPFPRYNAHYRLNPVGQFKSNYATGGGNSHPGWFNAPDVRMLQFGDKCIVGGRGGCTAGVFRGTERDFARQILGK